MAIAPLAILVLGSAAIATPLPARADESHDHHDHHDTHHDTHHDNAATDTPHTGSHHHTSLTWPSDRPLPAIGLVAEPDAGGNGWTIRVLADGFRFAPERLSNPSDEIGEGHVHLYLDGKKIARLYGPWYHLPPLPPGDHILSVTLSTNRHQELVDSNGQAIGAATSLQSPGRSRE